MGLDNDAVKALYDHSVRIPMYWEIDAFVSRATENSIYRKRTAATLGLTADSMVLDGLWRLLLHSEQRQVLLEEHSGFRLRSRNES